MSDKKLEQIDIINEKIKSIDQELDNIIYDYGGDMFDDYPDEDYYNSNDPQHLLGQLNSEKEKLNNELRKLKTDISIEENNRKYDEKKKFFKNGDLISDNETTDDLLSRSMYSKIMAEYIVSKNTDTPFNIGIFGEWGEGKSSFLKLIEEEINILNKKSNTEMNYKTHIVRYCATEYSEQDKIWACILKKLFETFEKKHPFISKPSFAFHRCKKMAKKNSWRYLIKAFSFVLIIFWGWFLNKMLQNPLKMNSLALLASLSFFPLSMGIVNIVIPFIKNQLQFSKPLSDIVIKRIDFPNYSQNLGTKENIKEDLTDLLEVWLKKQKCTDKFNERLVLFVDEIDRCSEEGILELLEALQLFLSVKHIVIVMAVDFTSIYNALKKKLNYSDNLNILDCQRINSCLTYLEKYINIPFFLKYNKQYDVYIDKLLGNNINSSNLPIQSSNLQNDNDNDSDNGTNYDKYVFDKDEMSVLKTILNSLNNSNHITPRLAKRITNILIISKQICKEINKSENFLQKIQFSNYIKWFLFVYFYPVSSKKLLDSISNYEYYHSIGSALKTISTDALKSITNDIYAKNFLNSYLSDIKIYEIHTFKEISNLFIINEDNLVK